jgi:hypothetical protein
VGALFVGIEVRTGNVSGFFRQLVSVNKIATEPPAQDRFYLLLLQRELQQLGVSTHEDNKLVQKLVGQLETPAGGVRENLANLRRVLGFPEAKGPVPPRDFRSPARRELEKAYRILGAAERQAREWETHPHLGELVSSVRNIPRDSSNRRPHVCAPPPAPPGPRSPDDDSDEGNY